VVKLTDFSVAIAAYFSTGEAEVTRNYCDVTIISIAST